MDINHKILLYNLFIALHLVHGEVKGPYRIQSANFPKHKIAITAITDEAPASIMEEGRRFLIHQPGLTGAAGSVSFEAADWPGHYLRYRGSFLYVDLKDTDGFSKSATFMIRTDLMTKGYHAFEAISQPGFYIRHANYKLRLHKSDNSPLFKADASFRFLEGPYLMQSENMKNHVLGIKGIDGHMVDQNGILLNFVHPGLSGAVGSVSLESATQPGSYFRHYGFRVDLEDRSKPRNPGGFDADATFRLCKTGCFVDGYVSLEATNFPGMFMRHSNYRVVMAKSDNSPLFKHDASFKFINEPTYMDSFNYPGYRIDPSTPQAIKVTTAGQQWIMVYPGLTGERGSISLESLDNRDKYLRVTGDRKLTLSDGSREDQNMFKKQATFLLRDSPWYAGTFAFESYSSRGSYVMRQDFDLKIQGFESTAMFKASASFVKNTRAPLGIVTQTSATLIQSYNFPNHTFGFTFAKQEAYIMTSGKRFIISTPGLSGHPGSISFLSADRADTYLRQYGGLLVAENRFEPRNPLRYLDEGTFIPQKDKWYRGYYGFEAVTGKNTFIRHSGYRLLVSRNDNSELLKKDASFRAMEGPYTLQSQNLPNYKLGLSDNKGALMTPSGHPWYFIRPGLSDDNGSLSLESTWYRKSYLRHYNYLVDLEDIRRPRNPGIFKQDGSFYMRRDQFYSDYFALEPVNMKDHFVRHQNYRVRASKNDNSDLFKKDSSFRATHGPFLLESFNFRGYGLSVDNKGAFYIGRGGTRLQFVYPGLTGRAGTVSLEIYGQPGTYLRHANYLLKADKLGDSNNKQLFRADATWWLREEVHFEKTLILESYNFPNYFLRHANYRLRISKLKDEDLFRKDSSFMKVAELRSRDKLKTKGPFMLQNFASADKFINVAINPDTNHERPAFLSSTRGARFFIQTPGLNNRPNTISLMSADRPNHYLRHHNYRLDLEALEGSRNPHIFDQDASFAYLWREDAPDQVLMESVNLPGYFISGLNNSLTLVKANGSRLLRDLASFRMTNGPYYLESLIHENNRLKVTWRQGHSLQVTLAGERFYISSPGLSGEAGTVSISQTNSPNTHICTTSHKAGPITLVDRYAIGSRGQNRTALHRHCTFKENKNINFAAERFFAFESSAYENYYLSLEKHSTKDVVLRKSPSGGHIAMDEAGFRFIRGPLMLTSYNNRDKSLSIGDPPAPEISLSVNGTSLVMVFPGLSGDPGSASLQIADNRSMYLRHYNYLVDAEVRANPRNPGIFDKDASFFIRDDMWYKDTMALESVNFGSQFLHRDANDRVRITPADVSNEQYRKDASFIPKDVVVIDATLGPPTTHPSPLSEGAKAGVTIATIVVCLLLFVLWLCSGRIAAICCKHRTIVRKEGNYDNMFDGFDNPIYGTAISDFTLTYSPHDGVKMVESGSAEKPAITAPSVKVKAFNQVQQAAPKELPMTGIHESLTGYDESDVYVDMASIARKHAFKRGGPERPAIPNPLYDHVENHYPALATQSSVELYVDDRPEVSSSRANTMADSGLPVRSITDSTYTAAAPAPARPPTSLPLPSAMPGLPGAHGASPTLESLPSPPGIPQATKTFPVLNDDADEYVVPTSPIFFGLQPGSGDSPSIADSGLPLDSGLPAFLTGSANTNGFSSVDLFASPEEAIVEELNVVKKTPPVVDSKDANLSSSTNDMDNDIPEVMAPPVPNQAALIGQDDDDIYGEVRFSTKTKKTKDEKPNGTYEDQEDLEYAPPPLPPRSYDPETIAQQQHSLIADASTPAVPSTPQAEDEGRLKIVYDDDPDAIYASIEVEPTYLSPQEVLRDEAPPMLPPFPLDTPKAMLMPSYSMPTTPTTPEVINLPASASLAEVSNGVLGPKGEIIPLPTRKNSKGNLLDTISSIFGSDDGTKTETDKKDKKEKLPISLVNPLYDFEADYQSTSESQRQDEQFTATDIGENVILTDDMEEKAYNDLIQQKPDTDKSNS